MLIICLIEKHIFSITSLSGKVFENAFFADAVLEAKLLPELHPDLVAALSDLERDDFPGHIDGGEDTRVGLKVLVVNWGNSVRFGGGFGFRFGMAKGKLRGEEKKLLLEI